MHGGFGMRFARDLMLTMVVVLGVSGGASAQQAACTRDDFEAVVDEAADGLRQLNQKNRPEFQERLRKLREKRGWNQDRFIVEAAPFVRDEKIEDYDARSDDALRQVTAMGQEGAQAKKPDCRMLAELRGYMRALVDIQTEKWRYMFDKIDAELGK